MALKSSPILYTFVLRLGINTVRNEVGNFPTQYKIRKLCKTTSFGHLRIQRVALGPIRIRKTEQKNNKTGKTAVNYIQNIGRPCHAMPAQLNPDYTSRPSR